MFFHLQITHFHICTNLKFSFQIFSSAPEGPANNRAPDRYDRSEARAGHAELQGGRHSAAHHPVVQGRCPAEDSARFTSDVFAGGRVVLSKSEYFC